MSSNTTSSSFVSDDEVRYFKQTKVQCRFSNLPGKWLGRPFVRLYGRTVRFSKPCPASGAASSRTRICPSFWDTPAGHRSVPPVIGLINGQPRSRKRIRPVGLLHLFHSRGRWLWVKTRLASPVPRGAFCPSRQFIGFYRPEGHGSLHRAYPSYVNSDKWFFAQEDKWDCWQR